MKISKRRSSVGTCVVLAFMGITMVAGASWAADTKETREGSTTMMCKTYPTEMSGSSRSDTVLKICPEGVAYRSGSTGREHMIPWRNVERWRYHGPKQKGEYPGRSEHAILRIETTSIGWGAFEHDPRYNHDLRFKICCTAGDGYEVWTEMNKYRGTRRF